ncbi:MAG: GIY-YIG nuclease family protein [Candidatus Omnitrophota bacterium]|nr:MAG: GIY-YIG nuclease family protein [Candidatus Omnitrophota bacterium]
MHYVYILINKLNTKTYTGSTSNISKRLADHNNGKVKSSRTHKPYEILHIETFNTLKEAKQRECFYKTTTGRRKIRDLITYRNA